MLRTSAICTSFLYNYLTSDNDPANKNDDPFFKQCKKLRCLSDTLESYGGVLSKLSQMLSMDDQNSTTFSDCKPFSKEKTIKYFKKFIENLIENSSIKFDFINFDVYKSGSIGQVHKGVYKNKNIVFKVQYVGLDTQTRSDLEMLDTISSYIYHFSDLKNAMSDIKIKMYEELDYKIEAYNQQKIAKLYKNSDFVEIPNIIPELCTDKVLSMYFVEGRCLREFIENSTQDQKNKLGTCIVKFVFENIYKHGIFYSDIHYGNFLVKNDSTLCVLDFGCIGDINETLCNHLKNLHKSIKENDKEKFYEIVENMGIIDKNISLPSKKYIYDYFRIQYAPWISEEFEFTEEWMEMAGDKNTELMKEWILPKDIVYFNRIPYCMYHILTKLKLKGQFLEIFDEIFNSSKI